MLLSGSVFLITSDGKTLSLPVPSESPHDPLNWTVKKRVLPLIPVVIFSVTCLNVTQGSGLVVKGLIRDFRHEAHAPFNIETLLVAPTLCMGLGAFLWVPLTFALGRRPSFLIASSLLLISVVLAGISTNFYGLLLCICAMGFAEGFALSVVFLIIIDITFIHQRPTSLAAVWSIVGFISGITLSAIPFCTEHGRDWRGLYQYWTIPAAVACLSALFLFPETYFKRPVVAYDGLTLLQTASEKLIIYEDDRFDVRFEENNKTLPAAPSRNWFQDFMDQFYIRSTRASWKSMLACYPQILFCLLNPLIFWVVIMTAMNFAGMMYIGTTYAVVLSSPPYNLSSSLLIHVNTSSGVGSLLAWPLGGVLIGRILSRMSRRNKGVREAEHYLFGYILPVLTGSLSTLIYGCAVHYKWHFTTYYLSYGLNGFSFVAISITNTLWVTEAFPRWAAPALVVVGGVSYISSFALSFVLVPWVKVQGYLLVGIELMVLQLLTGLVITPIAFWGKGLRQRIHGRWADMREGALRPL
ncbi:major facilitator superfamily domain-containing protein [Clohesyomyces aquaticus]|uniref:Major facilitator superfamily domain-containing protein n=1 Tax=Clohesyomyces aquaticus TaxID=1231657 RepID=A0A1Y1ZWR7_9PLEO|nr:major facilitator superfamily domain-containing protein [Clohesyomyces aquaticus]